MTDRSTRPNGAHSRIAVTGGAVGLGLALVGAMAWADGSATVADTIPAEPTEHSGDTGQPIIVVPDSNIGRADLPGMATPARQSSTQAPVGRSQGS